MEYKYRAFDIGAQLAIIRKVWFKLMKGGNIYKHQVRQQLDKYGKAELPISEHEAGEQTHRRSWAKQRLGRHGTDRPRFGLHRKEDVAYLNCGIPRSHRVSFRYQQLLHETDEHTKTPRTITANPIRLDDATLWNKRELHDLSSVNNNLERHHNDPTIVVHSSPSTYRFSHFQTYTIPALQSHPHHLNVRLHASQSARLQ